MLMISQNKLKVQLKLSISRLRMTQQKDTAKAKQQRREMAQLIEVFEWFLHLPRCYLPFSIVQAATLLC